MKKSFINYLMVLKLVYCSSNVYSYQLWGLWAGRQFKFRLYDSKIGEPHTSAPLRRDGRARLSIEALAKMRTCARCLVITMRKQRF